MNDRAEDWTDITLGDAMSILALRVESDGLSAVARVALDCEGILIYVPTSTLAQSGIGQATAVAA